MAHATATEGNGHSKGFLPLLILGAIGVVYGDIGTSPLYAMKESFIALGRAPTEADVLGILSCIFWAISLVMTFKYTFNVLGANHKGEGGIPAMLGLLHKKIGFLFILLGIFGVGLLLGEGMITPAISVLSAFEGLRVIDPTISQWTVQEYTLVVLLMLFAVQRWGTGLIGMAFGPIMVVWFAVIGYLGIKGIALDPTILRAIWPGYAFDLFRNNPELTAVILGAVVLVITGGEALFADLGHFGKTAIQLGWWFFAMPALLLNYFGQGAYVLQHPDAVANPFFGLVPADQRSNMVILAVAATIIASQALITGAFSLTKQLSLELHNMPPIEIRSTSKKNPGQIYVPVVNLLLWVGCMTLVIVFKESTNLAAAYGIAVTGTMSVTSVLFYLVQRRIWARPFWKAGLLTAIFLTIDLTFFRSNLHKFWDGGYIPLTTGIFLALSMQFYFMHGKRVRWLKKQAVAPVAVNTETARSIVCIDEYVHLGTALSLAEARLLGLPITVLHALTDESRRNTIIALLNQLGVTNDQIVILDAPSGDWARPTINYIRAQVGDRDNCCRVHVFISQTVRGGLFGRTHTMSSTVLEDGLLTVPGITIVKSNVELNTRGTTNGVVV